MVSSKSKGSLRLDKEKVKAWTEKYSDAEEKRRRRAGNSASGNSASSAAASSA
jgi:hypothetical protein